MAWELDFITEEQFRDHVKKTIIEYGEKLKSFDLEKFNSNIIDPVKLIFDHAVYKSSWEETISNEIFRQRDKSNNNYIGYFHQYLFSYVKNCTVPPNGKQGGWDVIYRNPDGIKLPDGSVVHTVYAEMKNKHNTLNAASGAKTFTKMQNQLLHDDDSACFLVEVIAKKSQNIKWETTVDKVKLSHKLIRRVSIDKFYELVLGDPKAFYKICKVLPDVVLSVVNETDNLETPNDIVYQQLIERFKSDDSHSIVLALYMLGFSSYPGFPQ